MTARKRTDAWISLHRYYDPAWLIQHTDSLPLAEALWYFIENVSDENPARTELFFHLRERMRAAP